jgi:hypothetical protein
MARVTARHRLHQSRYQHTAAAAATEPERVEVKSNNRSRRQTRSTRGICNGLRQLLLAATAPPAINRGTERMCDGIDNGIGNVGGTCDGTALATSKAYATANSGQGDNFEMGANDSDG